MTHIFNKYYKKYDAWYDKNKFAYLSELRAVRKVLPRRGTGLEVGVGTGRFASSLGIEFGIDPSKKMLRLARQRNIDAHFGFGECLPFASGSFDYVVAVITLCFVHNPAKVLREAKRVLKRKGKAIIGIVDKDSFLGKHYLKKKSVFYKRANFFSVNEMRDLLKAVGFKRFSYYQTIFQLPEKINSTEKPQKGFGKGGFVVIGAQKGKSCKK